MQVDLSWNASTDNVGVTGYRVYRDGAVIANVAGTSYVDTSVVASTTYSYTVAAHDAAGNFSGQSAAAVVTTGTGGTTSAWANGMGSVIEGNYVFATSLRSLDVFLDDLNGTRAPADLPNTRCLIYRSVCSVNSGDDRSIPWSTANTNGWLLRDSSGALIYNSGFTTNNIGNISNSAFSTALANHAITLANTYGYKGVWFDDTVAHGGSLVNQLPTVGGVTWSEATWYANLVAHVGRVGAIVKAAGLECVFNANGRIPGDTDSDDGTLDLSFWGDLVATGGPTGLTREYFEESPVDDSQVDRIGAAWYQHWDGWRRLHPFCNSHGIDFMPLSYFPGGISELAYLRGSFLLDYTGGGSALLAVAGTNSSPIYPTFLALGAALGAATQISSGVWVRQFQNGTVTVNTNTGTATIA